MDDGNLLIAAMRTPVDHSTSQRVLDDEPEIEPAPVNPLGWPLGPLGPEGGASARSGSAVTAATTFRTDASYLPELHAYLDDLLRTADAACSPPPISINGHAPRPCRRRKRSAA